VRLYYCRYFPPEGTATVLALLDEGVQLESERARHFFFLLQVALAVRFGARFGPRLFTEDDSLEVLVLL
jgi:hypothetical protein